MVVHDHAYPQLRTYIYVYDYHTCTYIEKHKTFVATTLLKCVYICMLACMYIPSDYFVKD